jgi:hypothetical protein
MCLTLGVVALPGVLMWSLKLPFRKGFLSLLCSRVTVRVPSAWSGLECDTMAHLPLLFATVSRTPGPVDGAQLIIQRVPSLGGAHQT